MNKKLHLFSLIITILISLTGTAQITLIPDENFEIALINEGHEIGPPDGFIETWRAEQITILNVPNYNITDLTGIEDFTNLMILECSDNQLTNLSLNNNPYLEVLICHRNQLNNLDVTQNASLDILGCFGNVLTNLDVTNNVALTNLGCGSNQLASLDVTQNISLNRLVCAGNQLTSLDVTKNISLNYLFCTGNQLTSLDVTKNISLNQLYCAGNQLTSLDISNNINLDDLDCAFNQLISLNVQNGNNSLITGFDSTSNPSLSCIQVDNEINAKANLYPYNLWNKDVSSTYSEDCQTLSVEDEILMGKMRLYPNPTSNRLFIESRLRIQKLEIYSILGQKVKDINSEFDNISISDLSNGLYMAQVFFGDKKTIRKLIVKE